MKKRALYIVTFFIFSLFVISAIAQHLKISEGEEITYIDALYWTVTTVTTVGYGDITLQSPTGKLFSIFVQIYGIFFLFGVAVPYIALPWAEKRFLLKLPENVDYQNHVVIFGYSKLTPFVVRELLKMKIPYVIVENSKEKVIEALENNFNAIFSSIDDSIENANIEKAFAVILMWDEVEKDVDALLTIKDLNIQKIAVVSDPYYGRYLVHAGVDRVITPKSVAGVYIANIITERQKGALSIKTVLKDHGITEIIVPEDSILKGLSVKEIEEKYDVKIVGVYTGGKLVFRPHEGFRIPESSILLVFGGNQNLYSLLRDAQ